MGHIYKHTSPSGKAYIGQSWEEPEVRWRGHVYAAFSGQGGCPAFNAAISKYGPAAFTNEVLYDGIVTQDEMDRLEVLAIVEHGTRVPKGYNIRSGGSRGRHHESTKALLSERIRALYDDPDSVYHTDEFKKNRILGQKNAWDCDRRQEVSERSKAYWSDEKLREEQSKKQQAHWTEERRNAQSATLIAAYARPDSHKNDPQYRSLLSQRTSEWHRKTAQARIFGDGEFFSNQREAGERFGVSASMIWDRIKAPAKIGWFRFPCHHDVECDAVEECWAVIQWRNALAETQKPDPKRTQAASDAGHPEWASLPATAQEARDTGATFYFNGRPCKHGHVAPKYKCSGCSACNRRQHKHGPAPAWAKRAAA